MTRANQFELGVRQRAGHLLSSAEGPVSVVAAPDEQSRAAYLRELPGRGSYAPASQAGRALNQADETIGVARKLARRHDELEQLAPHGPVWMTHSDERLIGCGRSQPRECAVRDQGKGHQSHR